MSGDRAILDELDAEARAALEDAAAARGISVEDLLNETLLLTLLDDAGGDVAEPQEAAPSSRGRARESFAVSHRLDAVERRLHQAVAGVDQALAAYDQSLIALGARLDEADLLADESYDTAEAALAEVRAAIDALDNKLGRTGAELKDLARAHDAVRAQVLDDGAVYDQRLEVLEQIARSAEAETVRLADAHEGLKRALASDYIAHTLEVDQRFQDHASEAREGLDELSRAIDAAHLRLEEVAARAAIDLGEARAALEQRLGDEGARLLARIDAAADAASDELAGVRFALEQRTSEEVARLVSRVESGAEVAARQFGTLQQRLNAADIALAKLGEEVRTRVEDVERVSADKLAEFAAAAERGRVGLGAELERAEADLRAALVQLEARHADGLRELASEHRRDFAELNDRQLGATARLRLLDAADVKLSDEVDALRVSVNERFAAAAEVEPRLLTVETRLEAAVQQSESNQRALAAEIERVEASTLAALEAGVQHRKSDHDALKQELERQAALVRAELEAARQAHADNASALRRETELEFADVRNQHKGVVARLRLADEALASSSRTIDIHGEQIAALGVRFDRVEADWAVGQSHLRDLVAAFGDRIESFGARMQPDTEALGRLAEINARLVVQEHEAVSARQQIADLARLVAQSATQGADAATALETRLHAFEQIVAGLQLAGGEGDDERERFEERLRGELEAMRQGLEERNLALEAKTVRALDQLTQTLALLSRKFALDEAPAAARSA